MTFKSLISSAALIAAMGMATAPAANAGDWTLSTDFVGEYVFRGFTLGAESIQPGIEYSSDSGWTFGVWGNTGVGEQSFANADEIDFYGGYSWGLTDTISADVGATLYHYPQSGGVFDIGADEAGTVEVYGGLGFDMMLEPNIYVYYDTTLEVITVEGGVGGSVASGERTSFDYGLSLGTVEPDQGEGYQYGTAGVSVAYAITDAASAYFGLNGSAASEDNFVDTSYTLQDAANNRPLTSESSTLWYSLGVSVGF